MKKFKILSIDGGGIRGIIPGTLLAKLETYLREQSGNADLKIADVFDMVAGTSTGGILTCLYLCPSAAAPDRPQFSASEAVDLYLNFGDDIFDIPIFKRISSAFGTLDEKYPAKELEKILLQYLGDTKLSQLVKPCVITAYDIAQREAVIFNSADNRAQDCPGRDFFVRDVARATSAAPTYFEPANIQALNREVRPLIDGGVFANNPALCAAAEFLASPEGKGKSFSDIAILSLGTGGTENRFSFSEAKNWGGIGWIKPVIDIALSGGAETVRYQLTQIFKGIGAPTQYLRIDPELTFAEPEMDNASLPNMDNLVRDGEKTFQENEAALKAFADEFLLASTTRSLPGRSSQNRASAIAPSPLLVTSPS